MKLRDIMHHVLTFLKIFTKHQSGSGEIPDSERVVLGAYLGLYVKSQTFKLNSWK